jgi:hypothetical protein
VAKKSHDNLADEIISLVYRVLRRGDAPVAKVYAAVWNNVNAGSASLSDITLVEGLSQVKGCPKMNADTFAANDPILVIHGPGIPYTIIGKTVGDIKLAA